jgi:hypothetical protein
MEITSLEVPVDTVMHVKSASSQATQRGSVYHSKGKMHALSPGKIVLGCMAYDIKRELQVMAICVRRLEPYSWYKHYHLVGEVLSPMFFSSTLALALEEGNRYRALALPF